MCDEFVTFQNSGSRTFTVFLKKAAKADGGNLFAYSDLRQFKIGTENVVLRPGESKTVHVSFVSDFFGAFSCNLEVFVNEDRQDIIELVALAYKPDTSEAQ